MALCRYQLLYKFTCTDLCFLREFGSTWSQVKRRQSKKKGQYIIVNPFFNWPIAKLSSLDVEFNQIARLDLLNVKYETMSAVETEQCLL